MTDSLVARGLDQLRALLTTVAPDDLGRPTPCADWEVAALCDHLVNSTAGMATMAQGGEPDWAAAPHHDDPVAAFDEQARALLAALADGAGAFPEGMAAAELAVHSYDLATALGRATGDLDPELAEAGHSFMSASLTDEARGEAFGPAQQAPADAGPYERLAAFAGRRV